MIPIATGWYWAKWNVENVSAFVAKQEFIVEVRIDEDGPACYITSEKDQYYIDDFVFLEGPLVRAEDAHIPDRFETPKNKKLSNKRFAK